MDKKELRTLMRVRERSFLSGNDASRESEEVWRQLESRDEFRRSSTVLVYMSLPGEPDTSPFLRRWYGIKRLVIPLVVGESLELREYHPDHLVQGYHGIWEPSQQTPVVDPSSVGLAVVPGIAFAPSGVRFSRLGHGGGFYDRLLPALKCPLAGVCFSFRLVDTLPSESWDAEVDFLCCRLGGGTSGGF